MLKCLLCSEPETGASVMSDALSLSSVQSVLTLLDVEQQQNVDVDLGLAWDPLVAHTDVMTQLLSADHLPAGQLSLYCICFLISKEQ